MKVYLGGSLQNARISQLAHDLRSMLPVRTVVFDDWCAAHPKADDNWRDYEKAKGLDITSALEHSAGKQVYNFDRLNLLSSDVFVLVAPAGKSAHLEAGYMAGLREAGVGKKVYALVDNDPERYDVMYRFFDQVFTNQGDLVQALLQDDLYHMMHGRLR